jgi:hypothetical protein
VRLFDPTRYQTRPLTLRHVGPLARFDHHRRVPPAWLVNAATDLWHDPERAVIYLARTLSCCLVEVFGETLTITLDPWLVAVIRPLRPLRVLDLRGSGAMAAGAVAALAKTPDRDLSQAWARWFHEQTASYGMVDGLLFSGAYNDEEVLVLFERVSGALSCRASEVRALRDSSLRPLIDATAATHGLVVL